MVYSSENRQLRELVALKGHINRDRLLPVSPASVPVDLSPERAVPGATQENGDLSREPIPFEKATKLQRHYLMLVNRSERMKKARFDRMHVHSWFAAFYLASLYVVRYLAKRPIRMRFLSQRLQPQVANCFMKCRHYSCLYNLIVIVQ